MADSKTGRALVDKQNEEIGSDPERLDEQYDSEDEENKSPDIHSSNQKPSPLPKINKNPPPKGSG